MKNINIICFGANLTSFFAFNLLFNYWKAFDGCNLFLARIVASVTSSFSRAQPELVASFTANGLYVTEHVGIITFVAATIIMSAISLVVACIKRVKLGRYRFFVPLVFSSVGIILCILYVSFKNGLHLIT